MINKHAHALAVAATKYFDHERNADSESMTYIKQDYEDLMSIAQMIENDEKPEAIAKAMWKLDTLVRDVIPNSVYYTYCK